MRDGPRTSIRFARAPSRGGRATTAITTPTIAAAPATTKLTFDTFASVLAVDRSPCSGGRQNPRWHRSSRPLLIDHDAAPVMAPASTPAPATPKLTQTAV